jgi:hypothetical protein
MPVDINGYSLSNSSGLTFGSSTTKIDSSGRMFIQNHPAFFGSRTGSGAVSRAYPWPFNSAVVNVGNAYSTSTYVYTCPVAGLYFTSFSIIVNATNGAATATASGYVGLVKNGVLQHYTHWNTNDVWDNQCLESILSCAAGDTISYAVNIAPAPVGNTSYGGYGDNHQMVSMWLIG